MTAKSNYLKNKLTDWFWRGQTFVPPTTHYFALLTTTKGPRANSTAYALNDTISLIANDTKTHMYKCTTAGTSAAAQSTLYPGVNDEVITDGSAVFTEQATAIKAGSAVEVSAGGGYARVGLASSLVNYAGTQGATTTTASTGTSGTTSNNSVITFGAPAANWGFAWGIATYDAASAGNLLEFGGLLLAKTINNGDPAPAIAISAFTSQDDN